MLLHSPVEQCDDRHCDDQPEGMPLLDTPSSIHQATVVPLVRHTRLPWCRATEICIMEHMPGTFSIRQAVPAGGRVEVVSGCIPARGGGCQQRGQYTGPEVSQQRMALTDKAAVRVSEWTAYLVLAKHLLPFQDCYQQQLQRWKALHPAQPSQLLHQDGS